MLKEYPESLRISTSRARDHLSQIVTMVQDPRAYAILTRHEKPVAAIVSMSELGRIWAQKDISDTIKGKRRRAGFYFGPSGHARTLREAAEEVQKNQLDRRQEREILKMAGLPVVKGGEILTEVPGTGHGRKPLWKRCLRRIGFRDRTTVDVMSDPTIFGSDRQDIEE